MVRNRSLLKWLEAVSRPHFFSFCSLSRCTVHTALNQLMRWCNEQTLQRYKAHYNIHSFYRPDGCRDVFRSPLFVKINIQKKNLQKCLEVKKKGGTLKVKHTKMIWPTTCLFNLVLCGDLLDFVEKVLLSFALSEKVLACWMLMLLLNLYLLCGYWLLATLEATNDLQATCLFRFLSSSDLPCLEVKFLSHQFLFIYLFFCCSYLYFYINYQLAAPWNKLVNGNSNQNYVLD